MYNWSVDEKELKKDKRRYAIWKLEQMVNFGLGGEKISELLLKKHWNSIAIDPARRKFLALLLRSAGFKQNQLSGTNSGKIQGARSDAYPKVRERRATKKLA